MCKAKKREWGTVMGWIASFLNLKDEWALDQMLCIMWALWERRNTAVFHDLTLPPALTLVKAAASATAQPPASAGIAMLGVPVVVTQVAVEKASFR